MTFSYFPRCLEVKERKNTIAFVHKLDFGTNMFCNYSFRELRGSYLTTQTKMWTTTGEKYMFISHAILTNAIEQTDHLQPMNVIRGDLRPLFLCLELWIRRS